ncbi:MAG: 16S rRNA (guanine(527)-N(7))-methyltransferase RsmG [Desulfobacteraceae bacterium]|nr:16S rRNA (guanine(527)-N(7))-methyltransferase RsmG [Desulfobacteraceae bacterium]
MKIGSPAWCQMISDGISAFDLKLDIDQMIQLATHAETLVQWNTKVNLTSITRPVDIAVKHMIDSLIPASYLHQSCTLLDIGSGGGFPGIPIKVIRPDIKITLIDASRKRTSFLNHVIRLLKLDHARAIHIRAEELIKDDGFKNAFDVVVCRALTSIDKFVQMAVPFLKKGGMMIALKGKRAEIQEEINLMAGPEDNPASTGLVRNHTCSIKHYSLPFINSERSLLILK